MNWNFCLQEQYKTIFLALNEKFKASLETQSLPDFTTRMETMTGDHPANQAGIRKEFKVKREYSYMYNENRWGVLWYLFKLRDENIMNKFKIALGFFICRNWWKFDQNTPVLITRIPVSILTEKENTMFYHVSTFCLLTIINKPKKKNEKNHLLKLNELLFMR